jgi:hypothetical protein
VGVLNAGANHSGETTYDVTPTGPKGFQVSTFCDGAVARIVGDFASLVEAEALMRQLDAGQSHDAAGRGLP